MNMRNVLVATWAFGALAACGRPADVPAVVLPDSPTAVERSAAAELAGELAKCLGAKPEVVSEKDAKGATCLFVGATRAAKAARGDRPWETDGVFLKSVEGGVVLDGDPARAPIYAVDLYLEKYCGARWWTSKAAHYPKLDKVPLSGIDLEYAPQFKYRETYYLDGFDPLFKVRSKGNFTSLTRFLLTEIKFVPPAFGGDHRLYFFNGRRSAYHSFFEILPPKTYFEKHPDWYSLVNGKREPKQLCLANAEMKAEYIKETLRRLREDPSVDFIQVSQNDSRGGYCTCEKCKAMMDEAGGVPSGPYLRFANDVAEAVEKVFPNVRIDTFAYMFTRRAPAKTKPRRNVVVRLCDIECDFARPLADASSKVNAAFAKDLADWRRVAGGNLFIWDYLANFRSYMMPHPNIGSIAPNIRLFAASGAVGVFEQGDALCSAGSFAALRHYVAAHLLWDPKDDEKRLADEFIEGYYGKSAAPAIRRFIALVEAGPRKTKKEVGCYHDGAPFLAGGDKLEAARLMDEAVAAAGRDGGEFAERVRRERLSVDQMLLLNYGVLKNLAAKTGCKWTRPATRAEAVENWIRDVKAAGVKAARETTSANAINAHFDRLRNGGAKPVARKWPDGSPMDAWFADKSPVDEAKLGRLRRAEEFGAKPDSDAMQTEKLQGTIDAIASSGGGVLVLGPGVWNTSSIFFKPGVHLKLENGAVLKGPADGGDTPRRMTRMMGLTFEYNVALVNADRCDGFTLYGSGTIDGNGRKTWETFWPQRRKSKKFHDAALPRPRNVYVSNSRDVRVSGIAIKDSHFWTTHFYKCERLKIDNVRITAPGPKTPPASPSTDGIDLDAVKDAHIWGAYIDVNDDAIALKGGKNYGCEKLPENGGNFNVLVENCVFGPVNHSAVTCGSEAFLCRNIVVRNCELRGCGNLLNLKSRPDTAQLYENILVENVGGTCRNVFAMRPWSQWFTLPSGVDKQPTRAANVVFRNCSAKGGENVKLDPSFMKLEGYVSPSGRQTAP